LYPAQALADGLYSEDDLPDSVVLIGIDLVDFLEMTRSGAEYSGVLFEYTYKIALGNDELTPNQKYWAVSVQFEGGSFSQLIESTCLITYPYPRPESPFFSGIKDQFADTYTVTWNISDQSGSSTATRQSICIWTFTALGAEYLIEYESVDFFRWRIVTPETEIFKAEPSFENTPTGYYETGGADFTVS
jgi:hypothetical protein